MIKASLSEGGWNSLDLPAALAARALARAWVLPVPHEATTPYRSGTRNGPAAIIAASRLVEWYDREFTDEPVTRFGIHTLNPVTVVHRSLEAERLPDAVVCYVDSTVALPLDALNPNEPYYLGVFLVGSYQDIMADLHNLFGWVNEPYLFLNPDEPCGNYIEETIPGSAIGQILEDVQYFEQDLARMMKAHVDQAVKDDRVKPSEGMRLLDEYEARLKEYTYLECSRGGGGEGRDAEAPGS